MTTIKEYEKETESQEKLLWLECLTWAGVDNWDGYDYARELFDKYFQK